MSANRVEREHERGTPRAVPLCLACSRPQAPYAPFCEHCGAPSSTLATHGPFERILTEGWMYRRATSGPGRPLVLLGIWLIFGPAALLLPLLIPLARMSYAVGLLMGLGWLLSASMLYLATRNYDG